MSDNNTQWTVINRKGNKNLQTPTNSSMKITSPGGAYRFNPSYIYTSKPLNISMQDLSSTIMKRRTRRYEIKVWTIPYWKCQTSNMIRCLVGMYNNTGELCPIGGSINENVVKFDQLPTNKQKNAILIRNAEREMCEEAGITSIDLHTHKNVYPYCFRWIKESHICTSTVYMIDISNMISNMDEEKAFIRHCQMTETDKELECIMFIPLSQLLMINTSVTRANSVPIWDVFRHFLGSRIFNNWANTSLSI